MSDIKLIHKETVLPPLYHMDWDVIIDGIPHFVVKVEGYVHTIGGRYGNNDLWAYPRDKTPCYETLIEFDCDTPVAWGIIYEPRNYTKIKWDEAEARSRGGVAITRNGRVFCHVSGGIHYGLDKARTMITEFNEHPLSLNVIDFDKKAIGRKVWWRSEPAIITQYINHQACVILEPDGVDRFSTPAEFAKEDPEYYEDGNVKVDILDPHIWWFRG